MTWTVCPSMERLFARDADADEELREHLATCRRCRALRRHLKPTELVAAAEPMAKEPTAREVSTEPALGSVYAIHGPLADEYLVGALVDWDDEEAVVVPVSAETRFATDWDVLLEEHLLGYQAMAEVWNHGTVLVEQLNEKLAELGEWAGALAALYEAALESRELPTPVRVGPPVLSDADPRVVFHDEESERVAVYWQPATLLAGVESVFELVRLQREELGLAPDDLDVARSTLEALEHGEVDVIHDVPLPTFAALLCQLRLGASRRLEQLAARSALATYRERFETQPALARKRKGMRQRGATKSPEQLAAEYARRLMEELGE